MILPFPYSLIAGAATLALAIFGLHLRDEHIRNEGDKAGYARAESQYAERARKATTAFALRAQGLAAQLNDKRVLDEKDLHEAEARVDELEAQLGKGKECTAWSKEVALQLRR